MIKKTLLGALTVGLLSLVPAATSQAAPATGPFADYARIRGVVVDLTGHAIQDVNVVALNAAGKVKASDKTYEYENKSGTVSIKGAFQLQVDPGTYTVKFSKPGYRSETIKGVSAPKTGKKGIVYTGAIVLEGVTRTSAKALDSTVKPGKGVVQARVGSAFAAKGTVAVTYVNKKKKVVTVGTGAVRLVKAGTRFAGSARVKLNALKKRGDHVLTVAFTPARDQVVAPSSDTVKLTVSRSGNRPMALRPNVW